MQRIALAVWSYLSISVTPFELIVLALTLAFGIRSLRLTHLAWREWRWSRRYGDAGEKAVGVWRWDNTVVKGVVIWSLVAMAMYANMSPTATRTIPPDAIEFARQLRAVGYWLFPLLLLLPSVAVAIGNERAYRWRAAQTAYLRSIQQEATFSPTTTTTTPACTPHPPSPIPLGPAPPSHPSPHDTPRKEE